LRLPPRPRCRAVAAPARVCCLLHETTSRRRRRRPAAAAAAAAVEPLTSLDARLNDFNIAAELGAGVETQKPRSQHIN